MKLLAYLKREYHVTRPGDVTWSHAVNSHKKLGRFLNNPQAMIIESDIRLSIAQRLPVAVHPPATESDLNLYSLLSNVRGSNQALKLDFKDPEILIECLDKLRQAPLSQPVILNADILQGNGAAISKFSAAGFIALCQAYYPQGTLSIGWTTTADPAKGYTAQNIDDMLALCGILEDITFPVRACLLRGSWPELQRLLATKKSWTLTVWNNELVSGELRNWIKANTDPARTFYDFIDDGKDSLRLW